MSFLKKIFTKNPPVEMYRGKELHTVVHYSPLSQMSEIIDGHLYLGSLRIAMEEKQLKERGITDIINASMEERKYKIPVKCMVININDNSDADISLYFDMVADKIDAVKKENGRVLVHCVAGVSRSATLVIAYLMKYYKMTLKDSHDFVKKKRSIISPNYGFWNHLIDYEKKLFGKSTVEKKETAKKKDVGYVLYH
ncbi:dual specificity protein phosphatase 14 [Exaiptasia diaphana]|uniref:protein-serine/threonine phosphatase n=1 Tax=Exaiptasia diaphana TaxID=2652724 RepID=A0A913XGX5_EXADI|nr:dual specificity protein phosphatase 14 [Exaiptasia diaphana]KXJ12192.1 Dual specificity protein phosphatase 14 [Exaiptasia diaphana]